MDGDPGETLKRLPLGAVFFKVWASAVLPVFVSTAFARSSRIGICCSSFLLQAPEGIQECNHIHNKFNTQSAPSLRDVVLRASIHPAQTCLGEDKV